MHAFTVIDESVLDVTACAGLCMMTGDGMVARDGMAAEVAWQPDGMVARDGGQMAWWPEMVARWHGGQRWWPDGMVAGDGGQMAWWLEMAILSCAKKCQACTHIPACFHSDCSIF